MGSMKNLEGMIDAQMNECSIAVQVQELDELHKSAGVLGSEKHYTENLHCTSASCSSPSHVHAYYL